MDGWNIQKVIVLRKVTTEQKPLTQMNMLKHKQKFTIYVIYNNNNYNAMAQIEVVISK
jgi:hypothetical protein